MERFRPLSRQQIARIVGNDQEAIRAFEKLFQQAGQLTPDEILILSRGIEDAQLAAGSALALVAEADAALQRLAQDAGLAVVPREPDNHARLDYLDFHRVGPHVTQPLRMQWNEGDGTIDVGLSADVTLQIGQETLYFAKNTSGATIENGAAVMFTGTLGASSKLTFALAVADGSSPAHYMMGIATETIADNAFGYVTAFGIVRGFDVSGGNKTVPEVWADGDILYLDPNYPGELTKTAPVAPDLALPIAVVLNAAVGSGSVFVRMKTGEYLRELHDVSAATPASGDVLTYNGSVWVPAPAADAMSVGLVIALRNNLF